MLAFSGDPNTAELGRLRTLSKRPGISAHALSELTFNSDQSFGTLAGRLVQRGLVERHAGGER